MRKKKKRTVIICENIYIFRITMKIDAMLIKRSVNIIVYRVYVLSFRHITWCVIALNEFDFNDLKNNVHEP